MGPTGMLRRRMECDVIQCRRKRWINHLEGLNGTIQIHVKDGILVMPQASVWPCYLVTYKADTIVTRIGLNLLYCGSCSYPRLDSGLHSNSRTDRREVEKCRPATD